MEFRIRPYQRKPTTISSNYPAFLTDALRKAVEAGDIAFDVERQLFYHVHRQFFFDRRVQDMMREFEQAGYILRGGSMVNWKREG